MDNEKNTQQNSAGPVPGNEMKLNSSLTLSKILQNKLLLGLIAGAFFGIGIFIVFLIMILKNPPPKKDPSVPVSKASEDVKKIAKEQIDFIERQRRPDGYYDYLYKYDEQCTTENGVKKCPFGGVRMFETTNAWTALAYYSAYRILDDPKYLDQATKDLHKLADWCARDRKECNWVLVQPAIVYKQTRDPKILAFLKAQGEVLLESEQSLDLMLLSIETRELVMLYKITADEKYLDAAQKYLDKTRNIIPQLPLTTNIASNKLVKFGCWTSLAAIEYGLAANSVQTIIGGSMLLEKGNVLEGFSEFPQSLEIQPCIESYFQLAKYDTKYKKTADLLVGKYVEQYVDLKENILQDGSGGSLSSSSKRRINMKRVPSVVTDTAYSLFLLTYK